MGASMAMVSAGLQLVAAKKQMDIANMQAAAYRDQAELEKLQAQSAAVDREKPLFAKLASLNTGQASRGASINSATTQTLALNEKNIASMDITKIKLMGASKANKLNVSASIAKAQGKAAMISGVAGAAGTMGTTIGGAPGVSAANGPTGTAIQAGSADAFMYQLKGSIARWDSNQLEQAKFSFQTGGGIPNFAGLRPTGIETAAKELSNLSQTYIKRAYNSAARRDKAEAALAGLDIVDPETGGIRQDLAEKAQEFWSSEGRTQYESARDTSITNRMVVQLEALLEILIL